MLQSFVDFEQAIRYPGVKFKLKRTNGGRDSTGIRIMIFRFLFLFSVWSWIKLCDIGWLLERFHEHPVVPIQQFSPHQQAKDVPVCSRDDLKTTRVPFGK